MPAEGLTMGSRSKVYVDGVPFQRVALTNGEHVELYDTSGPGSDPGVGLVPLRAPWVDGRGDVATYDGRPVDVRDDGRAAVRRAGRAEQFTGSRRPPLRAGGGRRVTQLHYARRGEVTPEMRFVATRERCTAAPSCRRT